MRLVGLGLLLCFLVSSYPAAAQSTARDGRFGAVQAINSPDKAAQAGVAWERIMFPWAEIQPGSPDESKPGYYTDERIAAQAKRGVTLVGVIVYTPTWAAEDPSKGWAAVPKGIDRPHTDAQNTFARFVNRLAAKYKGTVDQWIIWNEPDLIDLESKVSPTWSGTEQQFWNLQKSGYLAIKQANPQAKVLLPGFSHWHAKEAGLQPYLKRLLDIGAADTTAPRNNWYFDGVPTHAYANPLNSFALPTVYRRMLAERGLQDKGIWIIESNAVPWDDPIGQLPREPWRASMDEQSSYVIQAFALGVAADIERMSIYKMRDEFVEDGQYFGLIREDGSARPAFTALQTAIANFAGTKKATYTWNGSANPPSKAEIDALLETREKHFQYIWPGQVSQVALERDGQRVTVIWNVSRRPLVGVVTAGANEATLLDAYGRAAPIRAQDGAYRVYLSSARANTEPRDPSLLLVGGRPWIIVEKIATNARASQPPRIEDGLRFENGFSVANASFAEYFKLRGGKNSFGLPISREFDLQGAPTQIFQRQVMQLTPEGGVRTLNLLDPELMPYTRFNGSVLPGADDAVKAQTPSAADRDYAEKIVRFVRERAPDSWQSKNVSFGRSFFSSVTCADAFPGGSCQESLLPLFNLEVWGAPISGPAPDPANADFIYQRFQRGVLHHDVKCGCTQGLLLGEYFKAIVTGQGLPPDLEEQAKDSLYFKQYDQTRVQGMSRPFALLRSSMKDAFEPEP
ncbi:MAG: hypothetical protein ACKVVP_05710 [Chloroflexota bacterium]